MTYSLICLRCNEDFSGDERKEEICNLPQVENRHAVLEFALFNIVGQHGYLSLGQCGLVATREQARAVLHTRAQSGDHDAGADLVVLLVGSGRLDGNGLLAQRLHEGHLTGEGISSRFGRDLGQPLGELAPDAHPNDGVRQQATVEDSVEELV